MVPEKAVMASREVGDLVPRASGAGMMLRWFHERCHYIDGNDAGGFGVDMYEHAAQQRRDSKLKQ
jgi:hypothetical protein